MLWKNNFTALHLAAFYGHSDCIQELLNGGSENNAYAMMESKESGHTALFCAAQEGHLECLLVLLQYFPSKDRSSLTHIQKALGIANQKNHESCVDAMTDFIDNFDAHAENYDRINSRTASETSNASRNREHVERSPSNPHLKKILLQRIYKPLSICCLVVLGACYFGVMVYSNVYIRWYIRKCSVLSVRIFDPQTSDRCICGCCICHNMSSAVDQV
eukprot:TRINITY_DN17350_c0_g2_i1.p1 TRINITY_DN17350_c0_g2~~TRINITY_DN17350_c0_g2_i1.p1  ORF type:complete len:217 (+),score=20.46 TRINITY_DN17350_c0_g2_i1:209-859(+)